MRNKLRNVFFPLSSLIISIFLLLIPFFSSGGRLNMESAFFLCSYNDPARSIFSRIFDPFRNDWSLYQARELSYFTDLVDAEIIALSSLHGNGNFHSVITLLFTIGILIILQISWRKLFSPELDEKMTALTVIFLTLTPCVMFNAFFRSAKYGTALGAALAAAGTAVIIRERGCGKAAGRAGTFTAAALLLSGLFDRQGAFLAAIWTMGCGTMLLFRLLRQRGNTAEASTVKTAEKNQYLHGIVLLTLKLLSVNFILFIYARYLAPLLIFQANGYWPDGGAQKLDLTGTNLLKIVLDGWVFNFGNLGTAITGLGGISGIFAGSAAAMLLTLGYFLLYRRTGDGRVLSAGWLLLMFELAMTAAGGVMSLKHPYLLTPWVMTSAYFLPALIIYGFFGISLAGMAAKGGLQLNYRVIFPVMLILVALKTQSLFRDERIFSATPAHEEILKAINDQSYDTGRLLISPPEERLIRVLRGGGGR